MSTTAKQAVRYYRRAYGARFPSNIYKLRATRVNPSKRKARKRVATALRKLVRGNPAAASWGVKTWQGTLGPFSNRRDAVAYAKRLREANRQAGNKGSVTVVKIARALSNPAKGRKVKGVRAVTLKNFTGTITRLAGGQVKIQGKGRR